MRQFEFETDCLFFGKEASARVEKNKSDKIWREIYEVRTIEMGDRVITRVLERGDEWGDVLARAKSITDLVGSRSLVSQTAWG